MINEANVPAIVHLDTGEIWVTMFRMWGFSYASMRTVTRFTDRRIKGICSKVTDKLGRGNPLSVSCYAQTSGFNINGTLNGEDIFSDEMKWKILLVDPFIKFLFPPGKKK